MEATLTTSFDTKEAVRSLKGWLLLAASRADKFANPASDKQCWFMAKLIVDNCKNAEEFETAQGHWLDSNRVLSSREASSNIDDLLNKKN